METLTRRARLDLSHLNFPALNWVPAVAGPDGKTMLDALIVGGGMCGQTAAFALLAEGVRNLRCVDRASRGREGPWANFARMETLRSPKHLTGPDLGVPSLTYRAWHEARFGEAAWQSLHKIPRLLWAEYLLWVRSAAELPVENEVEVVSLGLEKDFITAILRDGGAQSVVYARKVVLALGREGSGAPRWPDFETFDPEKRAAAVFHSAEDIDFETLKGKSVGVLGAGASAFDNAGEALEAGAASVTLFARRPILPQVNKSKWTSFPGFQEGYSSLDDAQRWRFYTYIFSEQVPPPYESVLRCERHPGFSIRFAEGWQDIAGQDARVMVKTEKGRHMFDAVIVATGFDVNLVDRAEIASFRGSIETWRSHVPPNEAEKFPEEARFPYLGDAFQLQGKTPGLGRVHLFNWGATLSHGAIAGDIPGLEVGVRRLAQGIARDLFLADANLHWQRILAHNEDELKATKYFVNLSSRPPA
ncbi:MAG: NAD(P)/FAD-dependent oxidoreductase [Candidatus Parcubacteria bacterium]|nr:NAD(P)/FAD-dependent oxidoreductase [Burkholderiales bacterium]